MGKPRIRHGDIFAVPLPDGTFLFGRVMLDVYATTRKRLSAADSPLPGLGKSFLIEMYEQVFESPNYRPSDVLVPGAFVEPDEIGTAWPVVANVAIDVHDVQFPESLIGFNHDTGEVAFECGEIRLLLPFADKDLQSINVWKTRHSAFLWPYLCLHELGRANEIPAEYAPSCQLWDSDLRFSRYRQRVYEYLPLDPYDSYYQQQEQLGLHLERFYE